MPIKAEPGWTSQKDIHEFEARFGKSENPRRDTRRRLERNLADLDSVLASGIDYFQKKRGTHHPAQGSPSGLRAKIELFTDLLPDSADTDYLLRFTTTLAQILWLESERARILAHGEREQWLYPSYHLADCFASAAFDLEEALACEHDDFGERAR